MADRDQCSLQEVHDCCRHFRCGFLEMRGVVTFGQDHPPAFRGRQASEKCRRDGWFESWIAGTVNQERRHPDRFWANRTKFNVATYGGLYGVVCQSGMHEIPNKVLACYFRRYEVGASRFGCISHVRRGSVCGSIKGRRVRIEIERVQHQRTKRLIPSRRDQRRDLGATRPTDQYRRRKVGVTLCDESYD